MSPTTASLRFDFDTLVRKKLGERVSGDAVVAVEHRDGLFVAVVDGLGHGPPAAVVAERAKAFLADAAAPDVGRVLQRLHEHLRGTIGAVASVAFLHAATGDVLVAGVGNISVRIFGSASTRFTPDAGVVGQRVRSIRELHARVVVGDVLVMHTDGVSERFELKDYPRLLGHGPADITRSLVRRFGKDHDDAGCVAVKVRQ